MQPSITGLWDSRLSGAPNEHRFDPSGNRKPPTRPNIIFLLADDLGWGDLGCYGSLHIRTPHLDELARGGVRFTHAYSSSAVCSPMRISLYTGRYPGRLEAGLQEPIIRRDHKTGIPAGHPTLPSLLRDAGYSTSMFGKWHCGWLPWFSPLRIGFDTFFGNLDGSLDYFTHIDSLGKKDLYEGETPVEKEGYYTWLIADRAAAHVRQQNRDTPFYMQVNWNAPHWPWEGPGDRDVADQILQGYRRNEWIPLLHNDGGSLAKYAEIVEAMDDGVGRILQALDERGLRDNTIVIFSSDNGGERYSFMWPFIGGKGDLSEGGIRVPFILRWPDALDAGCWSGATSITMDWTATLLDAAGAKPHPDYPLDGSSLLPWLTGNAELAERSLFWRSASQGALRRGQFKYFRDARLAPRIHSWPLYPGVRHQLFDVSGDGREAADIAQHHPGLVDEMSREWDEIAATLLPYPPDYEDLPRNVLRRLRDADESFPD